MFKRHRPTVRSKQAGFTIVELMVATTVFSVILVVITVGVMYFTRSYYKGVYASMTQNTARTITDTVTQAIQFGADSPVVYTYKDSDIGSVQHFCAGGYVYVFELNVMYDVSVPGAVGMYMQPMTTDCTNSAGDNSALTVAKRQQLLGNRMRVTFVDIAQEGDLYSFDIKIAYGENDLLDNITGGPDVQCRAEAGSEYCAIARLTATAHRRKG